LDEAEEAAGGVVVAGGDAAIVFQAVDAALNAVAERVDRLLDAVLDALVAPRRDLRLPTAVTNILPWSRSHRVSVQNPGGESPFCASRAVVCPDDSAVDHLQDVGIAATIRQRLQQNIPEAGSGPAPILPVDRIPVAQLRRQVAPGNAGARHPEDGIRHPAVTTRRAAAEGTGLNHKRLEERPFLVRQQTSQHQRLPPGGRLESSGSAVKHFCPRHLESLVFTSAIFDTTAQFMRLARKKK
jgi:hypothetical protein